jgi:hypothetical protein
MLEASVTLEVPVRQSEDHKKAHHQGTLKCAQNSQTHANGCSTESLGYGSQCFVIQWYYNDIADSTRSKMRLKHKVQSHGSWGFGVGLVVGLSFVGMLHARTWCLLEAVKGAMHTPSVLLPTAPMNCSAST